MPQLRRPAVIRSWLFPLTVLLLLFIRPATALSFPPATGLFQQIGDEESIPDNVVTRVLQDQQGFIWIGTPAGLIRYDGYRFRRYTQQADVQNSLPGKFIIDMLLRPDGTIWIIAEPGGVAIYRPQSDDFQRLTLSSTAEQQRLIQNARTLTADNKGNIWLGGRDGFMVLDPAGSNPQFYQFDATQGPSPTQIRVMLAFEQYIFIGAKEGLFAFDTDRQQLQQVELAFNPDNPAKQILSLAQTGNNSLWIGTSSQGLFQLDLTNWRTEAIASGSTDNAETAINAILAINEAQLWLGRFNGIDYLDIGSKRWLGKVTADEAKRFGLPHSDIRSLIKDKAGQIWVGGYGSGVRLYQGQAAVSILNPYLSGPFRLNNANISSILETANGEIWLGSRGEGIDVLHRQLGVTKRYLPQPGQAGQLQQGWITTMAELASGEIWLGVNPAQLYRFSPSDDTFQPLGTEYGFWQANVRKLFVDSRQRLWLGTNEGAAVWQAASDSFQRILDSGQQPIADYINGFAEDQQATIWLATGTSGLLKIGSNDTIATAAEFSRNSAPAPDSILGILFDRQHRLWLDTPQGLYVINDTRQHPLTLVAASMANQSLPDNLGANLLQDKLGRIWTQRHIYQPDSGELYPLTTADGVYHGTNWYRSYAQTRDGLMLFGGSEGLLVIQPEQFIPWQYMPPLQATSVRIDGKPVPSSQSSLLLPADARGFSVEFAGLDLSAPGRLQYRYQLQGFDRDWRYTDASQRLASYTNLWPGHYQLRIETTNRNQQWSPEGYTLNITVAAAFWQTPWFIMLLIALLLMFIYTVVKLRTRILRHQARQLEAQISARTDELKKAQGALVEKEKMAALGQVVAGIAHEINTPLGVSVTACSLLQENTDLIQQRFNQKQLTSNQLQQFLQQSLQHLALLTTNLNRSADLVQTFKEVAIDESMNNLAMVNMQQWLQQRLSLLGTIMQLHQVEIVCPAQLQLQLPAKALEMVLFHLLNNSLIHGLAADKGGKIQINVQYDNARCTILFQDDGKGVAAEVRDTLFQPFVTTKRGSQCKGLGLHLCYNLMTQVLGGSITLVDSDTGGSCFRLTFPATSGYK